MSPARSGMTLDVRNRQRSHKVNCAKLRQLALEVAADFQSLSIVLVSDPAMARDLQNLIRDMQAFGVSSLLLCVVCMLVLFAGWVMVGKWIFAVSLVLMVISLAMSIREIQISVGALDLQMIDLEKMEKEKK